MKRLLATVLMSTVPLAGAFAADAHCGAGGHPMILACEASDCRDNFLQALKHLIGPASKPDKGNAPVGPVQNGCQGAGWVNPVRPSPFSLMLADSEALTPKLPARSKKKAYSASRWAIEQYPRQFGIGSADRDAGRFATFATASRGKRRPRSMARCPTSFLVVRARIILLRLL
ncbi:MAG: hypothetical protein E6614_13315 [Bradyrhizobium sp.]|jgi:hypothetical protein|uniref:Uncharacterized protein n=1 Tax=Bradyrhizobium denitrificans TaxID=2734912 RepID=A0ABS5GC52_9BRAD|nr:MULTISPECIES: hypothetical protein [Bradyrhizobium]MBR1138920.1 hypothetical protein [Bradyrhizobium denitrificans]MDU0955275.1 hypothetical protein [Bradyrhizobium sp.]MDU1497848.1 hypothetical protein [Bradyrhizobium sp.]MDU1548099.1 hypothetical protein [Bradyrhizobium sp.]MDU1667719.1 hypothetical protein [Bradyrhizobium sp.]